MEIISPGLGVEHHFCDGVYMKETFIEHGYKVSQHVHHFDHLSVLASGMAEVEVDGIKTTYRAPKILKIKAGKVHEVTALTDVIWICTHRDDETDPAKIDASILSGEGWK